MKKLAFQLSLVFVLALAALSITMSVFAQSSGLRVRLVHAAEGPAGLPVDVYVDGTTVLTNFTFGTVSQYYSFAGTETISVTMAGNVVLVTDLASELPATTGDFSVVAGWTDTTPPSIAAYVLTDNNTTPGVGQGKFRFAHFISDVATITQVSVVNCGDGTVVLGEEDLFSGQTFAYGEASPYAIKSAGTYCFQLTYISNVGTMGTGTFQPKIAATPYDVSSNAVNTFFALGSLTSLQTVKTVDAQTYVIFLPIVMKS